MVLMALIEWCAMSSYPLSPGFMKIRKVRLLSFSLMFGGTISREMGMAVKDLRQAVESVSVR